MLHVRPASLPDASRIAEVHVASWLAAYQYIVAPELLASLDVEGTTRHWQDRLAASGPETSLTSLVEENGRVVGFVTYGPYRDGAPADSDRSEIYAFYLHPDAWRRRVGSHLMDNAIASLNASEYGQASVWVFAANARAIGFYEAAGFQPDGNSKPWKRGEFEHDEIRLSRSLESDSPGVAESEA